MRFLLLDRIEEIRYNQSITGVKCWSLDNFVFMDHFPGYPLVPGVLLTESMAQLLGILIEHSYYKTYGNSQKVYPVLSIIQKIKLRGPVLPGDRCIIHGELTSLDINRGNGKAFIEVDGVKKAEGSLSFSIANEQMVPYKEAMNKRKEYTDFILQNTAFYDQ